MIINWVRGVDNGEETVQMSERANRYPDFVRYIVQQLKSFCPLLGRYKIADILARAGLHLSASTVKRMIDEPPIEPISDIVPASPSPSPTVQAWYADHVWSVDLTVVPLVGRVLDSVVAECIDTSASVFVVRHDCDRPLFPPRDGFRDI
jgi:hypothetical protein